MSQLRDPALLKAGAVDLGGNASIADLDVGSAEGARRKAIIRSCAICRKPVARGQTIIGAFQATYSASKRNPPNCCP